MSVRVSVRVREPYISARGQENDLFHAARVRAVAGLWSRQGRVSPEAAAIIEARLEAASSSQPEEFNVENVAVLGDTIMGPVLLMSHLSLTDLEQLLLTEVNALRSVTDTDTQRIRECPTTDGRTDDDLAAQYKTTLDLMALHFNKAYDFLYWELYTPCLGWDCEGAEAFLGWLDPAHGSGPSGPSGPSGAAGGAAGL